MRVRTPESLSLASARRYELRSSALEIGVYNSPDYVQAFGGSATSSRILNIIVLLFCESSGVDHNELKFLSMLVLLGHSPSFGVNIFAGKPSG